MAKILAFDHMGVVVRDLEKAKALLRDVFGAKLIFERENQELGTRMANFRFGDKEIGVHEPINAAGPFGKFLSKRGEGLQHIGALVEDVEATVAELEAHGIRVVNKQFTGAERREALVHPSSFMGIALQLIEWRGQYQTSYEARMRFEAEELEVPTDWKK